MSEKVKNLTHLIYIKKKLFLKKFPNNEKIVSFNPVTHNIS